MEKLDLKLREMCGKSFMYMGSTFKINGHYISKERVHISTDSKMVTLNVHNAMDSLKEFMPVADNSKAIAVSQPTGTMVTSKVLSSDIISTVMNSIKMVQDNPDYIKQADGINRSVKTLLDIAKTELSYRKYVDKY